MYINLQGGEQIIKEGPANHFKGFEGVGGRLFITNQRVFFNSHAFNIQVHQLSIKFSDIKSVGKRNTLFIVPNGLFIELLDGTKEKFVIFRRASWIEAINQQINKLKSQIK